MPPEADHSVEEATKTTKLKRYLIWLWRCVEHPDQEGQDQSWAFERFGSNLPKVCIQSVNIPGPERIMSGALQTFNPHSDLEQERLLDPLHYSFVRNAKLFKVILVIIGHEHCRGFTAGCQVHRDTIGVAIDLWRGKLQTPAYGAMRRLDRNGYFGPPEEIGGVFPASRKHHLGYR